MALSKKADRYDQDLMRDMKIAQERHGASLSKQVFDFLALRGAGTGMSFEEYHFFELYKRSREEYASFMGNDRARAAFFLANSLEDWDAAEDKLNFAQAMEAAGLPTPKIHAFIHASRDAEGVNILRNDEDIVAFLAQAPLPLFGKPAMASHGDGTVHITGRDGDMFVNESYEKFAVEDLLEDVRSYVDGAGYLFQEALSPQNDIAAITNGRLATMRLVVTLEETGPAVRYGVIRLPAGENRVDNFRRKGNLVAPVDCETGTLGAARRGIGVHTEIHPTHPDTGATIEGVTIESFGEARDAAMLASQLFPALHLQSWDVAITEAGPFLLEVNPGGNFNILQHALGRGVFDPNFRKFLEAQLNENPNAARNPKAFQEARKLLKL